MKIPEGFFKTHDRWKDTFTLWYEAADKLSMQYGMAIRVEADYNNQGSEKFQKVSRLTFKVEGHIFDSITDLKKAIRNKAFL